MWKFEAGAPPGKGGRTLVVPDTVPIHVDYESLGFAHFTRIVPTQILFAHAGTRTRTQPSKPGCF